MANIDVLDNETLVNLISYKWDLLYLYYLFKVLLDMGMWLSLYAIGPTQWDMTDRTVPALLLNLFVIVIQVLP